MKPLLIIYGIAFFIAGVLIVAVPADYRGDAEFIFASSGDVKTIDPQRTSLMVDFRILECLYDTLVDINPQTSVFEPGAAERWNVSENGKTYTFHIRDDARWSNGDPVTSHDYVYGWRRAMLPDSAADYTTMMYPIVGAEDFFNWRVDALETYAEQSDEKRTTEAAAALWEQTLAKFDEMVGIETPDDKTLIVHLNNPNAYFLELCAFMVYAPIHEKSYEQYLDPPNPDSGRLSQATTYFRADRLISNGPYVLERRRPKRDLLLKRNPHYWDHANVQSDSVLMRVINSPAAALLAFENGEIDWWPDVPSGEDIAADLIASGDNTVHTYVVCGSYYLYFNCTDKLTDGRDNPLKDPRVRWAFSLAIDRKTIVEDLRKLNEPIGLSLTPPGVFRDYESPVDAGVEFNPERARQLLEEAGYPGGKGLERLDVLFNANSGHDKIFERLANEWKKHLNVDVNLDIKETNVFFDQREKHNFAIARGNWYGDYGDPTTFLDMYRTGDGNNDAGWSDPSFDDILKQAEQETDVPARMKLLQDAERMLVEQQVIAPILHSIQIEVYDDARLKNYFPNPMLHRRLDRMKVVQEAVESDE